MNSEGGVVLNLAHANWRKSRFSQGNGACIEVADGIPGIVPVRDSKTPQGPALVFSANGWASFISSVKEREIPAP